MRSAIFVVSGQTYNQVTLKGVLLTTSVRPRLGRKFTVRSFVRSFVCTFDPSYGEGPHTADFGLRPKYAKNLKPKAQNGTVDDKSLLGSPYGQFRFSAEICKKLKT